MADIKKAGKKVSTLGIQDPRVRRVIEELAARIVELETAVRELKG